MYFLLCKEREEEKQKIKSSRKLELSKEIEKVRLKKEYIWKPKDTCNSYNKDPS